MTDLTCEQIEALLVDTTPGPWRKRDCDVVVGEGLTAKTICHFWRHWSNDEEGIEQTEPNARLTAAAPDLARTALALHQQLADAQAAQALLVERAADCLQDCNVWCDSQERPDAGWRNGVADAEKHHMVAIRALADPTGVKLLAEMRARAEKAEAEAFGLASGQCLFDDGTGLTGDDHGNAYCQMQRRAEAAEAQLAEAQKREAGLRAMIRVNMLRYGPADLTHEDIDRQIGAAISAAPTGEESQ